MAAEIFGSALLIGLARDRPARHNGAVTISLVLFAAAVARQVGDRPGGWLCDPDSIIQGHAAWHVLATGALFPGIRTMESRKSGKELETTSPTKR